MPLRFHRPSRTGSKDSFANSWRRSTSKEKHTARAVKDFKVAHQRFAQAINVSPVEMAQLLYGLARARLRQGKGQHAAVLLREALHYLEPTTAEQMR